MPVASSWPPDGRGVPHSYTLFCPPLLTAPRIARDFVASVLRSQELGHLVDAAAMCTSELVTNAYLHARGIGSLLWLAIEVADVRVTVYDGSPDLPSPRPVDAQGESGRGLHLVDLLTNGRWGTEKGAPLGIGADEGKGVWFRLGVGETGPPDPLGQRERRTEGRRRIADAIEEAGLPY